MELLIQQLDMLYGIPDNYYVSERDGRSYFKRDDAVVDAVSDICNNELITGDGRCNWDNINILREYGYIVFAGEKDSFGWLTGCVQKEGDSRILVYG